MGQLTLAIVIKTDLPIHIHMYILIWFAVVIRSAFCVVADDEMKLKPND